jgi:NADH dehydrogenase FAD-containing subunit
MDDIRQCVGANYCIDRIYFGKEALCIQNAATGREATMPHVLAKAAQRRKAVVIGAGPGGLEAARVCAERGHAVVLFERSERVGGQINLAARATWREALSGIVRWLGGQVEKLGVDLRLGTAATAELVLAEEPDIVVVATGGHPNKGRFKGAELAVSSWDIISGAVEVSNLFAMTTTTATRDHPAPRSWRGRAPSSKSPRPTGSSVARSATNPEPPPQPYKADDHLAGPQAGRGLPRRQQNHSHAAQSIFRSRRGARS